MVGRRGTIDWRFTVDMRGTIGRSSTLGKRGMVVKGGKGGSERVICTKNIRTLHSVIFGNNKMIVIMVRI